jgi:hypothetical protein
MKSSLFLTALLASAALAVKSPEPYADWKQSQLKGWLQVRLSSFLPPSTADTNRAQDHNVPAPHNADLLALVREHYADVSRTYSDALYSTWSDSKLRSYLLHHGIVSPHSTRESLVLLAAEQGNKVSSLANDAGATVVSAYAAATGVPGNAYSAASSVVSQAANGAMESAGAAYGAVRDAPGRAYDYVVDGWNDVEMREWLVDNGYVKSDAQIKSDEVSWNFPPSIDSMRLMGSAGQEELCGSLWKGR